MLWVVVEIIMFSLSLSLELCVVDIFIRDHNVDFDKKMLTVLCWYLYYIVCLFLVLLFVFMLVPFRALCVPCATVSMWHIISLLA